MNLRKSVFASALMLGSLAPCHAAELLTRPMQAVHDFFDALGRQDKPGMLAVVAPNVEVISMHQGQLRRRSIDSLADAVAAHHGSAIAEHIYHPIVQSDNDLVVVWAPYKFTIDGRVDHCGTDVITLGYVDNRWLIIGLSDNERKENCQ
ncbi:hypothetical protein [Dyella choica]|uniref:Nuclear transport factor 2 family protein n=1 Tax=Dyella choica TaxID=1927959 RepID=A0A3S0RKT0_9GAMM|nr:hypothetical protein [Dyella choica]RUL76059.1 hypothetical protein EKH80_10105 [Dyella choica]